MAKNTKAPLPNPLPLAGEGTGAAGGGSIRVAYHTGPTEIGFCGNHWQRGVAQTITVAEWHAMQLRADFKHYNFTEEK